MQICYAVIYGNKTMYTKTVYNLIDFHVLIKYRENIEFDCLLL